MTLDGLAVGLDDTKGYQAACPGRLRYQGAVVPTAPQLAVGTTVWLPTGMAEPRITSRMSGRDMGQATFR